MGLREEDKVFLIRLEKSVNYREILCTPCIAVTDAEKRAKKSLWKQRMASVKNVVAPMVDQSELAFRMMLREHGAHLCFSPMIHAQLFVSDPTYRRSAFATCANDRPLVVQFCANNPGILLAAALLVEPYCDAVDLNLGCPQLIAKRGHYGAYLQEDRGLICRMVNFVHSHFRLPLSCKIRILDDLNETIAYARALQKAGACMLTVHGRTREQRGPNTGLADWTAVRAVVDAVDIPVISNGNIQMPGDGERCLQATGANAVMSAEGILSNPFLFEGHHKPVWVASREYLKYAERYDANVSAIRAHLFRICHHSLLEYSNLRERLCYVCSTAEFSEIIGNIEERVIQSILPEQHITFDAENGTDIPHWICKPHFRTIRNDAVISHSLYRERRRSELAELSKETGLSKRQLRKREKRKIENRKIQCRKQIFTKCLCCSLPASNFCVFLYCRTCCRSKAIDEHKDCKIHNFNFSSKFLRCSQECEAYKVIVDGLESTAFDN